MRKKLLLFIFTLMMLPSLTKAASADVTLSCPAAANKGNEISCKVNVSASGVNVDGVSANYELSGLTYVSFTPQNGFATYYASANGFSVGNTAGKGGSYTLGVLKLKVTNAGSVTLKNIDVSGGGGSYSPTSKKANVRIKSTNNTLNGLSISNGTLSPSFSGSTLKYTATVNAVSTTINAVKGDNYQTISGAGNKTLKYGSNTFNVVVSSESGAKKTYTIVITRPDNRNTNNDLKSLMVDVGDIKFNKNTLNYTLNVDTNVSSAVVSATVADSTATLVSGFGNRKVNLNYGKNTILVKVKAENEKIKTYTIVINRKDDRSTNNFLKSLDLSNGDITFDKNNLNYNLSVYYDVTKIDITALAEDAKAKVVVNNKDLIVGDNIITIVVTAENQQVRTYTLNIKRLSEAEKMSDNNNVSKIDIIGHKFNFEADVLQYNISIADEDELFFNIQLEDENAVSSIKGNENLKDGSVVTVTSTSESGIEKTYKFNITKKEAVVQSETNVGATMIVGIICLILGGVIGYFLPIIKEYVIPAKVNLL